MDEGNTTNSHDNARSQLLDRFIATQVTTNPTLPKKFRGHVLVLKGIQWCLGESQRFPVCVRGAEDREFVNEEVFRQAGFGVNGVLYLNAPTRGVAQRLTEETRQQAIAEKERQAEFMARRVQEMREGRRIKLMPVPRSQNRLINKGVKPRRQGIMFSEAAMPDQRFTGGWAEVVSAWLEPEFRTLAEAAMSRMGWKEVQRFLQESSEWPPEIQEFVRVRASRLGPGIEGSFDGHTEPHRE